MLSTAKIYSTLGNPKSLIPLGVKDASSCLGMTAGSYVTGKEEGFDRFIDEIGTESLWLGGIPGSKWLIDKLIIKKGYKFDPIIDPRNLKNPELYNKIKEYAPNEEIKKSLEKVEKNKKLYKTLSTTKFFASTIIASAAYFGLTRLKQKYTEQKIRKNLIKEYEQIQKNKDNEKYTASSLKSPTFKSSSSFVKNIPQYIEDFAYNPVKNMYIMDGVITTERLTDSRNTQELIGYSIKEGSSLCFLYYAGDKIQKYLEDRANKVFNKNISLDSRIIEGSDLVKNNKTIVEKDLLKKSFIEGSISKDIAKFNTATISDIKLYEFLHKNPNNKIVNLLKLSGSIKLMKKSDKIDTRSFIDLEDIKKQKNEIEKLYNQYCKALNNGEKSEQFFKKLISLKRNSIKTNILSCILALGVLTPLAMLIKRLTAKSGPEFQTKKEIKEQLIREGLIKA